MASVRCKVLFEFAKKTVRVLIGILMRDLAIGTFADVLGLLQQDLCKICHDVKETVSVQHLFCKRFALQNKFSSFWMTERLKI